MEICQAKIEDVDAICKLLMILFEQEAEFEPNYEQ